MNDTLVQAIGIPNLILLGALVLVYLVTRVPWWIGHKYVPSFTLCQKVHRGVPLWRRKAARLMGSVPPELTETGFLAAVVWLPFVLLNLLLLAQVLGLYFGGGDPVRLGWFGEYSPFALLMGLLYSLAQSIFGLVAGSARERQMATDDAQERARARSLAKLFLILLLCTIGVEAFLAYKRASVLEDVAGTTGLWGEVITKAGPYLAAFLGFIAPVAHTVLGFIAYPNFVKPFVPYLLKLTAGLALWAWSIPAAFLFGFHPALPVNLPGAIVTLRHKTRTFRRDAARVREDAADLQENASRLAQIPASFDDPRAEVNALQQDSASRQEQWTGRIEELAGEVTSTKTPDQIDRLERQICEYRSKVDAEMVSIIAKAGALDRCLKKLRRTVRKWNKRCVPGNNKMSVVIDQLEALDKGCAELENGRRELLQVLRAQGDGSTATLPLSGTASTAGRARPATGYEDPQKEYLDTLRRRAIDKTGDPEDWQWAKAEFDTGVHKLETEVATNIEQARAMLKEAGPGKGSTGQSGLTKPELPVPTEQAVALPRVDLRNIQTTIDKVGSQSCKSLRRLGRTLRLRRKNLLKGRPLDAPRGRFWLFQVFSDLVEFLSGTGARGGGVTNTAVPPATEKKKGADTKARSAGVG